MITALRSNADKGRKICVTFTQILCTAMIVALSATTSAAQDGLDNGPTTLSLLSGESLRAAFSGRTMDGTYKQFRQRSGTTHFTETFTQDGKTIYREGKVRDTGVWSIPRDDVICFRYDGALSGGVSCFTVFREGTCLYSYNPSRIRGGTPIDNNQWSAKTVIRGELSTCDDLVS